MAEASEKLEAKAETEEFTHGGQVKPFLDHLEDLRWMIIKCLAATGIGMFLCLGFVRQIMALLQWPLVQSQITDDPTTYLQNLGVADPFLFAFKVGIFGGILLSSPLNLFFIGQFVIPALTRREKSMLWPVFTAGLFMFLAGAASCFFLLLPQTIKISHQFSVFLGWDPRWTVQSYYGFVLQFMIGMGIAFEVPVVVLTLVRMGILNPSTLKKYRPYVIVLNFLLAAVITPTTDALTLCLVAVPMILLYEACIVIGRWIQPRD